MLIKKTLRRLKLKDMCFSNLICREFYYEYLTKHRYAWNEWVILHNQICIQTRFDSPVFCVCVYYICYIIEKFTLTRKHINQSTLKNETTFPEMIIVGWPCIQYFAWLCTLF